MAQSDEPSDRDDFDLFQRAMSDVRPLADERASPEPRRRPPPIPRHRAALRGNAPAGTIVDADTSPGAAGTSYRGFDPDPTDLEADLRPGDALRFARAGIPASQLRRLRRGRITMQRHLDLHGMRSADAQRMLNECLGSCEREQVRSIRVVHGKGFGSPGGKPVLKTKIARWLRADSRVVAYCSALPQDGGTGALYVLLKVAG